MRVNLKIGENSDMWDSKINQRQKFHNKHVNNTDEISVKYVGHGHYNQATCMHLSLPICICA